MTYGQAVRETKSGDPTALLVNTPELDLTNNGPSTSEDTPDTDVTGSDEGSSENS
jgi:hypothetical protein